MEETEPKQFDILVLYPNGVTEVINLPDLPLGLTSISIKNRTYRIVDSHESIVKKGEHPIFPNIGYDWVLVLEG